MERVWSTVPPSPAEQPHSLTWYKPAWSECRYSQLIGWDAVSFVSLDLFPYESHRAEEVRRNKRRELQAGVGQQDKDVKAKRPTVLEVDDSENAAETLTMVLEQSCFRTVAAHNLQHSLFVAA